MTPEFNEWWDGDDMTAENPYDMGHPIYWAWEGWVAGQKAEREACATAIEELIPLLDPEREPTMRMCAYTCRNKYALKEKNHVS